MGGRGDKEGRGHGGQSEGASSSLPSAAVPTAVVHMAEARNGPLGGAGAPCTSILLGARGRPAVLTSHTHMRVESVWSDSYFTETPGAGTPGGMGMPGPLRFLPNTVLHRCSPGRREQCLVLDGAGVAPDVPGTSRWARKYGKAHGMRDT